MTAHAPLSPLPPSEPRAHLRAFTHPDSYDGLVAQPTESARDPQRRQPLILFLHGTGERGRSVYDVARQGLPRLLSGIPELTASECAVANDVAARFTVLAPQCAPYEVWDEARLLALLDWAGGQLNVDPARVYLTGLSMGGFGAWSLGLRHARRFAALVPICGGGRIADVADAARREPDALHRLGVWAFHGAKDRVVPLEESARMIEALRKAGVPDVTFTVYPEAEHDAWTPSYANPGLYSWLLRHAH